MNKLSKKNPKIKSNQAYEKKNESSNSIEKNEPVKLSETKAVTPIETNLKEIIGIIFDSPEIPNECYSILDENTRVSAFLRHRNTNYLDCLESRSMEPERLRISVISAIRYGKALVFDLMDTPDIIEHVERVLCEVNPSLFKELCDLSILKDERYLYYTKEEDGEDFKSFYFTDSNTEKFRVIFLSTKSNERFLNLGKSFKVV